MRRLMSFRNQSIVGSALVVLLLAGGMTFAIQRLEWLSNDQIAQLRGRENGITVVERLRWTGEGIVSAGRGYLLSADPGLLTRLRRAEDDFHRELRQLKRDPLDAEDEKRFRAVERAADAFMSKQRQLVRQRQQNDDAQLLIRRFEQELRPLQVDLGLALDDLVEARELALQAFYEQGSRARAGLSAWMYALLLVLVLLSAGTSWYFARVLSGAFAKEHEAHEAARRAVESRDELMGIVAHDLRNPLSSIAMRASMLGSSSESPALKAQAQTIERVTRRMEHLIKSMLDLATIESGRLSVHPKPWGVETLLQEASEMFDSLSTGRRISLERVDRTSPGLTVDVDRDRIMQVFSNLLGNALKFTPDGGRLVISAEPQGDLVRFSVTDSGPGIAREHLSLLFDRFWKRDHEGMRGTGLGLYISKGIVESHGGRLWAESEEGHGATFFFVLPAGRVAHVGANPSVEEQPLTTH